MNQMKVGTIGSGVIVRSILDAIQATDGINLEAVYSRTEKSGRELANDYGVQKVYTEIEDLLNDPDINFIYVASPNNMHFRQAKLALEHGKNVICEKPMAPEKWQVEALVKLARSRNLMLIEAVPTAFLPNFAIVKQQLPKIGQIKLVMSNYSQYSSRYDKLLIGEVSNVFNPEFAGGCLQDINFYNVYLNVALFGKPQQAVYYPNLYHSSSQGPIDTSGIVLLNYDGFVSSCAGAKDTWGINFVQIEGEKGYIYIKDGSNGITEVRVVTKTSDETFNKQSNPDRWFYEIQKITELVNSGSPDVLDRNLETTIETIGVIETARKNAGIYFSGEKT
ncbi:MAG: Gfo/Idh/MocA family oxidoreductase [Eubacteriales bacterium]|nr:Gfo/Idh/MocA family oxidoreductase [Eubacteriales bacterium]